jgi:hypothetical protein
MPKKIHRILVPVRPVGQLEQLRIAHTPTGPII